MADIRLTAAALELGSAGEPDPEDDPLAGTPEGDRADADHPRGERRETLEAGLGRPLLAGGDVDDDPEHAQPTDWKGEPD